VRFPKSGLLAPTAICRFSPPGVVPPFDPPVSCLHLRVFERRHLYSVPRVPLHLSICSLCTRFPLRAVSGLGWVPGFPLYFSNGFFFSLAQWHGVGAGELLASSVCGLLISCVLVFLNNNCVLRSMERRESDTPYGRGSFSDDWMSRTLR
jgi:hypothetical protein